MAKQTLQTRLVEALKAEGAVVVESRSSKYIVLQTTGRFYFVGKAGALRWNRTKSGTGSLSCSDTFKEALLTRTGK